MKAVICPVCGGSGTVSEPLAPSSSTSSSGNSPIVATCHGCGGSGWVSVPELEAGKG